MRHGVLHSVADLDLTGIEDLLGAARGIERSGPPPSRPFSVGMLFLSPSLRTRVGFAAAAIRLGGAPIAVGETRSGPGMSATESFSDTLRVLSGMVDVVVARTPFRLEREQLDDLAASAFVNGGDEREHPTQALADLYSIERARGPVGDLRVCLCGDLGGRAARSLIGLLDLMPPRELVLVAPHGRDEPGVSVGPTLRDRTSRRDRADFSGIDVLYMAGLAMGEGEDRLGVAERAAFALTPERLRELPAEALVLAPMPIIDEITDDARDDPRIGVFAQSDRAVYVRMAVLDAVLRGHSQGKIGPP